MEISRTLGPSQSLRYLSRITTTPEPVILGILSDIWVILWHWWDIERTFAVFGLTIVHVLCELQECCSLDFCAQYVLGMMYCVS